MTPDATAPGHTRIALVTGATGGMGAAISRRLAADGFDVAVAHSGNAGLADAVVAAVEGSGRRATAVAADIADESEVSALFDTVDERLGRVDVVVHTAGINRAAALFDLDLADFDAIHRVNVRGTFVVNQQAARRISGGGAIVNVSSTVVKLAPPALSAYTSSKAAVDAMTRILAKELGGRDITVNAVAPGPTATAAFLDSTPPDEREQLAALAPLGRLGTAEDVAGIVSFLVGATGRWVNGQVIYANGGVI